MSSPLVSVVVPVFNVEEYLHQCVDSVLSQTHDALEVVLVDDGSTDGSGAICRSYQADPRVRVIHQANRGLSGARNTGLAACQGSYVTFLDSDDWWAPTFVSTLLSAMESEPAVGVAAASFIRVPGGPYGFPATTEVLLSPRETIDRFAGSQHTLLTVAWAKLYRRDVLDGVRFPEGRLHEDEFTTYKALLGSGTALVPQPLYFYRQRSTGITRAPLSPERLRDAVDAAAEQASTFRELGFDRPADWAAGQWLRKQMQLVALLAAHGRSGEASTEAALLRAGSRVRLRPSEPLALRALGRTARIAPVTSARAFALLGSLRPPRPSTDATDQ